MPNEARIKTSYRPRPHPDLLEEEFEGQVWQPDVYEDAARVARAFNARGIIDVGCGEGAKLAALNGEFETVGLDLPINIRTCREQPPGTWIEHDLMTPGALPVSTEGMVVVCADVIEHVTDPLLLLEKLARAQRGAHALFLSTPERDLTYNGPHSGPPLNPRHVQEWTVREFCSLTRRAGLTGSIGLTRAHDGTTAMSTILGVFGPDLDTIEDVLIDRPEAPARIRSIRDRAQDKVRRELRRLRR